MSNPTLESTIHEILDLKRMREELDATITALKKQLPEIAAQFTKQTTARRFSIN